MKTTEVKNVMTTVEKEALISFKQIIQGFLGNSKASNYKELVENMLEKYHNLGCNMSIKMHYLHLDRFPENCGDVSDEQGEQFHQGMKGMERRYQGKCSSSMLADYCRCLQHHDPDVHHKRISGSRTLLSKKKRFY